LRFSQWQLSILECDAVQFAVLTMATKHTGMWRIAIYASNLKTSAACSSEEQVTFYLPKSFTLLRKTRFWRFSSRDNGKHDKDAASPASSGGCHPGASNWQRSVLSTQLLEPTSLIRCSVTSRVKTVLWNNLIINQHITKVPIVRPTQTQHTELVQYSFIYTTSCFGCSDQKYVSFCVSDIYLVIADLSSRNMF